MLATEYEISINGITLFRDHADKRKYYYLPTSDVRIADNGKKLNYYVYTNSEIKEGSKPQFNDDPNQTGGFLTLEVELGPTQDEINNLKNEFKKLLPYAIKQAVTEKKAKGESIDEKDFDADDIISSADEFVLAPVIFKEGDVKLFVLGEDGSKGIPQSLVKIVGSQHPSLYGKQNAVFSVRLGGMDAEIMYDLLTASKNNKPDTNSEYNSTSDTQNQPNNKTEKYINSQISVLYDLTYKAIEPAHYVKITVDFKAIEDYWDSHFEFDGSFTYGKKESSIEKKDESSQTKNDGYNIAIAADVDIEDMYRELINKGCIVVQQTDFTGNDVGTPLGADDPSTIELVKKLLSAELFSPTPLPKEDFSALKEKNPNGQKPEDKKPEDKKPEDKKTEDKKPEEKKPEEKKPEEKKPEDRKPEEKKPEEKKPEVQQAQQNNTQQQAQQATSQTTQTVEQTETTQTTETTQQTNNTRTYPSFVSIAGADDRIYLDEWLKKDLSKEDFEKYATKREYVNKTKYNQYLRDNGFDENGCPISDANNCNSCCNPCDNTSTPSPKKAKKFREVAGHDDKIDIHEWKKFSTEKVWEKYVIRDGYMKIEQYNQFLADKKKEQTTVTTSQQSTTQSSQVSQNTQTNQNNTTSSDNTNTSDTHDTHQSHDKPVHNTEETNVTPQPTPKNDNADTQSVASYVDALEWKLNANLAYTYKKRYLTETVKRTYIFNKQTAVNQIIHPTGMITVDGTDFDLDRQVMVGHLGDGFFSQHTIQLYSSLDFDTYHLKYIGIDIKHADSTGTVIQLTKEKPKAEITFYSEQFGKALPHDSQPKRQLTDEEITTQTLSPNLLYYKVTLVFDSQKCVGFDPDQSFLFQTLWKTTTDKVIAIGPNDIAGIYALNITAGNLTLNQGLNTALLSLLPVHDSTLGPSIYDLGITSDTNDTILLNPNNHYIAQINYTLDQPYNNIPISQRALTVTTATLQRKELIIQNPTSGMILFTTAQGEDTYQNIISIDILLQQGNREHSFTLTKRKPEYYLITNYNAENPEKITVKSVILNRNDGTSTNFTPNQTEFYTDRTEYILSI